MQAFAYEEQLIIRCLNDVENIHDVNNQDTNLEQMNLDSSNHVEFEISIISDRSSILSDLNPKLKQKKNLEAKSQITNSSLFKFDSGLTKSNFEDLDLEHDISKPEQNYKQKTVSIENVISDKINSSENDRRTEKNIFSNKNNENLLFQGQYETIGNSSIYTTYSGLDDDEVYVVKSNDDLPRARSQFIQRFTTINNTAKRHIVPNFIESSPQSESVQDSESKNSATYQQKILSQVAMNAISEPLSKIQNHLEGKISSILTEIETLKKLEDHQSSNYEEYETCTNKNLESNLREENLERIRYLENLQEKQFDMMSQLISMIGKENTNANLTASSGRESLNRIREQCRLIEPEFNDGAHFLFDEKEMSDKKHHTSLKNQRTKNKKLNSNNIGTNKCDKIKSRSRSRNRSNCSDSLSRNNHVTGCGVCLPRNQEDDCDEMKISNNQKKKGDFLEELLGNSRQKSPEKLAENPKFSSKPASAFTESIYDSQPTLFDKYLNEVKSKNLDLEKNEQKVSATEQESVQVKPSMFNDIKEILKAVEYSKSQIDDNLADLIRARDIKLFNLPNYHLIEKSDRVRLKKLVDGCVSAISNDVQKEVTQRLIDESKHIKLEAERDLGSYATSLRKKASQILKDSKSSAFLLKSKSSVGFGSSTSRSTNLKDKNQKSQSDTQKYIGKVFGKALLDKIKLEEVEERNEKIRKQLEEQKELKRQLILQKQQQEFKQPQSRLLKNISNSKKQAKTELKEVKQTVKPDILNKNSVKNIKEVTNNVQSEALVTPRPAFHSCHYNNIDNTESTDKNVALITVTPQDAAPIKPIKELKRQNLPSLSINPTSEIDSEPVIENKIQNNQSETINSSIDLNQSGEGIHLSGYCKSKNQQSLREKDVHLPSNIARFESNAEEFSQSFDCSNQILNGRNLLEKDAFKWIEAELIAKFIKNLANEQLNNYNLTAEEFDDVMSLNEAENESRNNNAELNILGAEGLRLITDLGSQIDPDFVEALIRECLEEKIAQEMKNVVKQPVASPRKRSLDRNRETMYFKLDLDYGQIIKTPIVTPKDELANVIPGNYTVGTQVSFESISQKPAPQPPITQQIEPQKLLEQKIEHTKVIHYYDDPETLLEETLTDQDGVCFQVTNYDEEEFNQIYMPRTPDETPVRTPSPDNFETPSLSQTIPEKTLSPPPKPLTKSTSIQCDPEVISKPEIVEPIVKIHPKPTLVRQEHEIDTSNNQTDTVSEDLTESTLYTSTIEETSTTLSQSSTKTDCSLPNDGDSYFSEGAWLLSKSEGQIIQTYEGLSKGVLLQNQQRKNSVGEVKLHERPQAIAKTDFSGLESGEVLIKKNDKKKSEGEIVIPQCSIIPIKNKKIIQPYLAEKTFEKLKNHTSKDCSKSSRKKNKDKTIIDISISPQKSYQKNNIQIRSIPNEILVRDSVDVERKIYSSTPDQSMFVVQALDTFVDEEEDFLNYNNSEDNKEIEIEAFVNGKYT